MPKQSDGSTMGPRAFVETAALGIAMLNVNVPSTPGTNVCLEVGTAHRFELEETNRVNN
jgi:hypothetical protein